MKESLPTDKQLTKQKSLMQIITYVSKEQTENLANKLTIQIADALGYNLETFAKHGDMDKIKNTIFLFLSNTSI